jgi:hypothetical protein
MKLSPATVIAGMLLVGLTACVPTTPTPAPTTSSGTTPTPTATSSASPSDPEEVEVTAAVVVMTASALSVFGTDGSTLASVNYEMDGAAAVAQIAGALDEEPVVTPVPGDVDSPCPPATSYEFGGLELRSPGSLGSVGAFEAIVTGTMTTAGVGIETIAAQQIGASRATFEAAVGEVMPLYEPPHPQVGIDVLNPEAGVYDRIGVYANFTGGTLDFLAAPRLLGFIGSCA